MAGHSGRMPEMELQKYSGKKTKTIREKLALEHETVSAHRYK